MKKSVFTKIILLVTVMAMILPTLMITGFAASDDDRTYYNATILNVKGGKDSIATLTFDDGVHSTATLLREALVKYDLKASLMVVPYRIQGNYGSGYSNVNQLTDLAAGGYLDIQSHSFSHLYMKNDGKDVDSQFIANNTEENRIQEIPGSLTWLSNAFPSQDIITFAVPGGGGYSTEAEALVMQYFYAARYNNSTGSVNNIQTLLPKDNIDAGGWYQLRNLWLNEERVKSGAMGNYLAACVNGGGWFITGCHNITTDATKLGTGNNDITVETLDAFLAELKAYEDEGKIWVATFSDATKYLREYQNSKVSQYSDENGMFVEVTMNATTEHGLALDARTFDMPLTVKVEIPEGWENVRFLSGAKETVVTSFKEGGKTYAYAEIVPNSSPVSISNADEELEWETINASVALAKGGANAIATMTFDDGLMATARTLNRLCEEFGLKASLMMVTDKIDQAYTAAQWMEIFNKGYLEPQSHSAQHLNVRDKEYTDAELDVEIGGSLATLNSKFPDYDALTFAIPSSNYTAREYEFVTKYFYAARGGRCVLNPAYGNAGNMQPLDPSFGTAINSWYNPSMIRMQANSTPDAITVEGINQYLIKCVNNNGWFISICHGIDEGKPADMTEAQMREIFSTMKFYQDQGKLWVATYSEATKYIRERQNSTVSAYQMFDDIYVDLTMSDMTEDGLPLDEDVFNMPLTVKIQLPGNWGRFTYRQGSGEEKIAYTFTENGIKYAYIDLVPNGGTAVLSNEGDPSSYVESLGMKQSVAQDESLTYNIYIPTDSSVIGVYTGKTALASERLANGYTKYSVGDIQITDAHKEFNFAIKFEAATGYADYTFTKSVVSYMNDVADSTETTEKDKQLVYDFTVFAKATVQKFTPKNTAAIPYYDELIAKLEGLGYTSTYETVTPSDLGTLDKVLNAAAFAINEKPYYVFYVNEGFTGTVTFTYGETSISYEVVNGYYHCKRYLVLDVEYVYDLASELSIRAEVKNAEAGEYEVYAEGAYSVANFIEGLSEGGNAPAYESALYSYILSAKNYQAD